MSISVGLRGQNKPMSRLKQGPKGISVSLSFHLLTKSPYMCILSFFPGPSIWFHGESPGIDHGTSKGKNDERISCLGLAVSSLWLLTEERATTYLGSVQSAAVYPEQFVRGSCEIFAAAPAFCQ